MPSRFLRAGPRRQRGHGRHGHRLSPALLAFQRMFCARPTPLEARGPAAAARTGEPMGGGHERDAHEDCVSRRRDIIVAHPGSLPLGALGAWDWTKAWPGWLLGLVYADHWQLAQLVASCGGGIGSNARARVSTVVLRT